MKFVQISFLWITFFGVPDMSLGLHFCFAPRIDIHFLFWMLSIGYVPLYRMPNSKLIAVSNSYHNKKSLYVRERSLP